MDETASLQQAQQKRRRVDAVVVSPFVHPGMFPFDVGDAADADDADPARKQSDEVGAQRHSSSWMEVLHDVETAEKVWFSTFENGVETREEEIHVLLHVSCSAAQLLDRSRASVRRFCRRVGTDYFALPSSLARETLWAAWSGSVAEGECGDAFERERLRDLRELEDMQYEFAA